MKRTTIEKALFLGLLLGALLACKNFTGGGDSGDKDKGSGDSAGKIGIAACDDFLDAYEKCIKTSTKIPSAAKDGYMEGLETMRKTYKESASNAAAKSALADSCKQASEQTAKAMEQFGCKW